MEIPKDYSFVHNALAGNCLFPRKKILSSWSTFVMCTLFMFFSGDLWTIFILLKTNKILEYQRVTRFNIKRWNKYWFYLLCWREKGIEYVWLTEIGCPISKINCSSLNISWFLWCTYESIKLFATNCLCVRSSKNLYMPKGNYYDC